MTIAYCTGLVHANARAWVVGANSDSDTGTLAATTAWQRLLLKFPVGLRFEAACMRIVAPVCCWWLHAR